MAAHGLILVGPRARRLPGHSRAHGSFRGDGAIEGQAHAAPVGAKLHDMRNGRHPAATPSRVDAVSTSRCYSQPTLRISGSPPSEHQLKLNIYASRNYAL